MLQGGARPQNHLAGPPQGQMFPKGWAGGMPVAKGAWAPRALQYGGGLAFQVYLMVAVPALRTPRVLLLLVGADVIGLSALLYVRMRGGRPQEKLSFKSSITRNRERRNEILKSPALLMKSQAQGLRFFGGGAVVLSLLNMATGVANSWTPALIAVGAATLALSGPASRFLCDRWGVKGARVSAWWGLILFGAAFAPIILACYARCGWVGILLPRVCW